MNQHVAKEDPLDRSSVLVRAPGKINLALQVSPLREDGYHQLLTVFQAVALFEDVEARPGEGITISIDGEHAEGVPVDHDNLAWVAAELLAAHVGIDPDVHLHITKGVPVAGGMAGGSADAAATLVACDALWGTGLGRRELLELAAELGSDVPFALVGNTAIGTGKGTALSPALARGEFHWAFGIQAKGMSTAAVYGAYDEHLAHEAEAGSPKTWSEEPPTAMMQALLAGDATGLGDSLFNDLELPALELNPLLEPVLDVAHRAGALGVVVSGSGPTVAALGRSRKHARAVAAAMTAADVVDSVAYAVGGVPGARIIARPN